MQFKLPGRASPDGDSRPSTPADSRTNNVWRGRTFHKTSDAALAASSATEGGADGDMTGRLPKRSNSFGLGLGGLQSLANGMSRAGESLSRKTTGASSDGTKTPPTSSLAAATTNTAHVSMGPPTLPDSSHLAQFSLRLSELVNRAFMPCMGVNTSNSTPASSGFAGAAKNAAAMSNVVAYQGIPSLASITYDGKKLPSKAVIAEIAKTVVGELEYASSVDPYLLRAASRSALKALSLFADRIDSLFVSPSKDPSVVFVPTTAKEGIHIPSSLEFNLGLITLEWIVEDALERCIEGPPGTVDQGMPHFVSEILTPVRKKMEGTILRTIQPLMANVKASLTQCIYKAVPMPFSGFGQGLSPVPSLTSPLADLSTPPTPSGVLTPGAAAVSWLRELDGRLDGCRRLLVPRIEERCGQDGEGWFISVAIHLIWKGLLVLTSRTMPMPQCALSKPSSPSLAPVPIGAAIVADATKRSPSPAQLTNALKSVSVKPRKASGAEVSSGYSTPGHAASAAVGSASKATIQQIQELQAFEKLVLKFAAGFEPSKAKTGAARATAGNDSDSSDDDDDDEDELARAALAEALQAIKSTILTVQYLDRNPDSLLDVLFTHQKDRGQHSLPAEVIRAAKSTPHLLLLHLVYARMPTHLATFASVIKEGGQRTEPIVPSPPSVFAYAWSEYERGIAGFAGGQSWAYALVDAWSEDIDEAVHLLDERERKLVAPQEETVEVTTSVDPSDSTPTPESVLLHRTVSARSAESDLDSVPEDMTASAPTLDTEVVRVSPASTRPATAAAATASKPSAWASLKQARMKSPGQSSDVSDTSASPETSPPRSPYQGAWGETSKSKRFWRNQSSQANAGTGFHLMGVGRGHGAKSSLSVNANGASPCTAQTEEERQLEEIHLEREGVRLLRKTIEAVDAFRKPKVPAEQVTSHS